MCGGGWLSKFRSNLFGQSSQSHKRHGRDQTHWELIAALGPTSSMRCVSVAVRQRPRLERECGPHPPKSNFEITATHRHSPRDPAVFYDHPRGSVLVLQAFTIGNRGDTLVLDMGRSVRILDLARP